MSTDPAVAADNNLFLADELDYLRACLGAMAVTPEAFDMTVLAPRLGRAVDALERVLELADSAKVWQRATLYCNCSECNELRRAGRPPAHIPRAMSWTLDPAKVRE